MTGVCKGIEAYEIFTNAIMTPWTVCVCVCMCVGSGKVKEQEERVKSICLLVFLLARKKRTAEFCRLFAL